MFVQCLTTLRFGVKLPTDNPDKQAGSRNAFIQASSEKEQAKNSQKNEKTSGVAAAGNLTNHSIEQRWEGPSQNHPERVLVCTL